MGLCLGCSAVKNENSAGITGAILRGDVFKANMGYVVSHCAIKFCTVNNDYPVLAAIQISKNYFIQKTKRYITAVNGQSVYILEKIVRK